MKKNIFVTLLVLTIFTSVVSGTLAIYQINLENFATDGDVIAKEFVITAEGTNNFSSEVLIAPTETVTKTFRITNTQGEIITETDMEVVVTVKVESLGNGIKPLQVRVLKGGEEVETTGAIVDGIGTLTFSAEMAKNVATTLDYTIEYYWPSTDNDIDFAGHSNGATTSVSVVATQK